jgi:hypothetical protein
MKIAAEKGNKTRPGIKLGLALRDGEHGEVLPQDRSHLPELLTVLRALARLAAAQAALEDEAAKPAKKK